MKKIAENTVKVCLGHISACDRGSACVLVVEGSWLFYLKIKLIILIYFLKKTTNF